MDRLADIDPAHPDPEVLLDIFLTQAESTARKTLLKKAIAVLVPGIAAKLTRGSRSTRAPLPQARIAPS